MMRVDSPIILFKFTEDLISHHSGFLVVLSVDPVGNPSIRLGISQPYFLSEGDDVMKYFLSRV